MKQRQLIGSYPGAIPWTAYDDRPAQELAESLCESAGCDAYCVDGVWYAAANEVQDGVS